MAVPATGILQTLKQDTNSHGAPAGNGDGIPAVWGDPVANAVRAGTVDAAYSIVPVLAALPADEYGPAVAKLRDRLGPALNLNDFRAAVAEARKRKPAPVVVVTPPRTPAPSATFGQVVAAMRRGLHIPNPDDIAVGLGAIQANRAQGEPVWPLLVGPPSRGKTERLQPLTALPWVYPIATLTEASLLSATPKRDRSRGATGGVLRQIGPFGIIVAKDLTSLLATPRDTQGPVLAALREVYDGEWHRSVGSDGGMTLSWHGKCGLIGGVTDAIDSAHALMSSLGERFIFYRLSLEGEEDQCLAALEASGQEEAWRAETAEAVRGLLENLPPPAGRAQLSDHERTALVDLARLAVRCRSATDRDPRTRELLNVPGPEGPTRLLKVLSLLLAGLDSIGLSRRDGWRILRKVALDSMPARRRKVFDYLREQSVRQPTSKIAIDIAMPTVTVRMALEDLQAHGVVVADKASGAESAAKLWGLSDLANQFCANAFADLASYEIQEPRCTPIHSSGPDPYRVQSLERRIPYKASDDPDQWVDPDLPEDIRA